MVVVGILRGVCNEVWMLVNECLMVCRWLKLWLILFKRVLEGIWCEVVSCRGFRFCSSRWIMYGY